NRSFGPPSVLCQIMHGLSLPQFCCQPAYGICRTVDPGVFMVATQDPLVGVLASSHSGYYIINRRNIPVKSQFEAYLGRPGAHMISNGQAACPTCRYNRTSEG